ncbi:DUF3618 domain-containing protein [Actinoallomurus acaciae]|uniref:DUF3618 domain-containing protein n=1 Tax=Actinoallomurus acaciae TaxID=502577 RepID=A0ABV5YI79_9ACTN
MSQDTSRAGRAGEREQLVAGIEQSRQDLVRTVRALSAKVDVPARVRGRAARMRERVAVSLGQTEQNIPEPARGATRQVADVAGRRPALVYGAAGVGAVAALLALSRRRRS